MFKNSHIENIACLLQRRTSQMLFRELIDGFVIIMRNSQIHCGSKMQSVLNVKEDCIYIDHCALIEGLYCS
jgi:hypothetical protein